jgi:hypothetical protein
MSDGNFSGKCFCGAVEIRVSGAPVAMGYCHCASCRSWSAGPVNAFTLWKPDAVKVTKGQDQLASYHKTDKSHHSRRALQSRHPRQLPGVGAAHPRRPAQDEGHAEGDGRLRRDAARVATRSRATA